MDLQGVSPTAVVYQSSWLLRHVVLPAAKTTTARYRSKGTTHASPCMVDGLRGAHSVEVREEKRQWIWMVGLTLGH